MAHSLSSVSSPSGRGIRRSGRLVMVAVLLVGCAPKAGAGKPSAAPGSSGGGDRVVRVVAAENFWGSIAVQLGGSHTEVRSIVSDPNADPHEYEATTADARAVSDADYVVLNGTGYDDWAVKLVGAGAANHHRQVLNAGRLLGLAAGANPHLWYDPDAVERIADRITADYERLDPAGTPYFVDRRRSFEAALQPYHERLAAIRAAFGHQPVASTESVFAYLAEALGLDLISPPAFMQATSEGNDPPAASVSQFEHQLSGRQVRVLVYNVQTATAVTTNLERLAVRSGVAVVGISETMRPAGARYQDWQLSQLEALQQALGNGRERR